MVNPQTQSTVYHYGIMERFALEARSMHYIACAVVLVFMNLVICQSLTAKFLRGKARANTNNIILFNLALSDVCYEVITSSLLLASDHCKSPSVESCKSMYLVYFTFNISTIFHIFIEMVEKMVATSSSQKHRYLFRPHLTVIYSICAWCISFLLALVCSVTDVLEEEALALLGRFRAFGYYLFIVISVSFAFVTSTSLFFRKLKRQTKKELATMRQETHRQLKSTSPPLSCCEQHDELVFFCFFQAFFVAWFGWLILATDSNFLKTIEIMKSFEVGRLCARILNVSTLLFSWRRPTTSIRCYDNNVF